MQLKMKEFIDSFGGTHKIAKKLGLGEPTIRVWLRGEGAPRAREISELIRLSKGELTFEVIYKESVRSKK